MHTLFDFITNVNGIQYILALLFIFGFIVFGELMKPKPFEGLAKAVAEDIRFIRAQEKAALIQLAKNAAMAPVYAVIYFASLPVLFVQGMTTVVGKGLVDVSAGGWNPVRAYFTGRKKAKKAKKDGHDSK